MCSSSEHNTGAQHLQPEAQGYCQLFIAGYEILKAFCQKLDCEKHNCQLKLISESFSTYPKETDRTEHLMEAIMCQKSSLKLKLYWTFIEVSWWPRLVCCISACVCCISELCSNTPLPTVPCRENMLGLEDNWGFFHYKHSGFSKTTEAMFHTEEIMSNSFQ